MSTDEAPPRKAAVAAQAKQNKDGRTEWTVHMEPHDRRHDRRGPHVIVERVRGRHDVASPSRAPGPKGRERRGADPANVGGAGREECANGTRRPG